MLQQWKHTLFSIGFALLAATQSLPAYIKIMPMGDSITFDATFADVLQPRPIELRGGYRAFLWYDFEDAGWAVDFVGSQQAGSAIVPPIDPDNEGHPGWTSYELAAQTYAFMLQSQPNIVLLHIGTNDDTADVDGVSTVLDEIDRYETDFHRHVKVYVALIIDNKTPDARIAAFNDNLRTMLQMRIDNGDDIVIVDMYHNAGLTGEDYTDSLHPNANGYAKMATVWFDALSHDPEISPTLIGFSDTLVSAKDIQSIDYDFAAHSVTFVTDIPDDGITF